MIVYFNPYVPSKAYWVVFNNQDVNMYLLYLVVYNKFIKLQLTAALQNPYSSMKSYVIVVIEIMEQVYWSSIGLLHKHKFHI